MCLVPQLPTRCCQPALGRTTPLASKNLRQSVGTHLLGPDIYSTSTAHRHAPCPTRWCRHRQHRQLEFDMVTDYNLDLLKIVQAQVQIVEPEGGRESAEQFGVRHGLAKRFSWWFVPAEPAMSRCGYDVEFLCLHCRWQTHVSVASGLGHELLGYDREKVVAAQPAASSCCIGNAQHRVVVPREQNADRAVDLGEGLTNRGWSNERWLRSSGTSWSAIDPTAEMSTSLCSLQTPRLRTNPPPSNFCEPVSAKMIDNKRYMVAPL